MKKIFIFLLFLSANHLLRAQCSTVGLEVSSSDTFSVQLYHPGFFNIPSGFANVCEWEITTFFDEIIYQETTSGAAFEQGVILFEHDVPLSDSMNVHLVITNEEEEIMCTIADTLYWNETEVLPGAFIGNWEILNSNGGIEEPLTSVNESVLAAEAIEIYPSLVQDFFQIKGKQDTYTARILDLNGRVLETHDYAMPQKRIEVSHLSMGIYFVQIQDKNGKNLDVKKILKL